MLAATSPFTRKIESGNNGWGWRVSFTTNAARSAAAPASPRIVCADPQPIRGARMSANTSSVTPPVPSSAPWRSNSRRGARLCWSAGSSRNVASSDSATIGRLTNSTQRHPGPSASRPPTETPTAAPIAEMPPQMPSAVLRSLPSRERRRENRERGGGHNRGANTLRDARADQQTLAVREPPASEQIANQISPATRTRRRPSRSAARPPSSRKPP